MTRLVMLEASGVERTEDDLDPTFTLEMQEGLTPQQELRQLRMKHGGWSLAPALITRKSMWEKNVIAELGRPLWTLYTSMAKHVKTPSQIQDHFVHMAKGHWKDELVTLAVNGG